MIIANPEPIKEAVVEIICDADDSIYDVGTTSPTGGFTLSAPLSQDFTVRVKARMVNAGPGS